MRRAHARAPCAPTRPAPAGAASAGGTSPSACWRCSSSWARRRSSWRAPATTRSAEPSPRATSASTPDTRRAHAGLGQHPLPPHHDPRPGRRPRRRCRQGRRRRPQRHHHAHALRPQDALHQRALHPARHARPGGGPRRDQDQRGVLLGRAGPGHQDHPRVHRRAHRPRHDRHLQGLPAPRRRRGRRRHVRARDRRRPWPVWGGRSPSRRAGTTSTASTRCSTCASARSTTTSTAPLASSSSSRPWRRRSLQPRNILKLPEIGKQFMSGLATDLTARQILELAYLKWRTPSKNVHKYVMDGNAAVHRRRLLRHQPTPPPTQRMIKQFLGQLAPVVHGDQRQTARRRRLPHQAPLAGLQAGTRTGRPSCAPGRRPPWIPRPRAPCCAGSCRP